MFFVKKESASASWADSCVFVLRLYAYIYERIKYQPRMYQNSVD